VRHDGKDPTDEGDVTNVYKKRYLLKSLHLGLAVEIFGSHRVYALFESNRICIQNYTRDLWRMKRETPPQNLAGRVRKAIKRILRVNPVRQWHSKKCCGHRSCFFKEDLPIV
jgi:hypothetical protein